MSYDEQDAARDEFYSRLSEELYPDHKTQAIEEFTAERLRSLYVKQPDIMRPAVYALREGKELRELAKCAAAVVFSVSAIELFLKATVLKPVVYGLVHDEGLAEVIVTYTLGQAGSDRYEGLLAVLFQRLAGVDLKTVSRDGVEAKLLEESRALQKLRNDIIHRGATAIDADAERAYQVAAAIFEKIVVPVLHAVGLTVESGGVIKPYR